VPRLGAQEAQRGQELCERCAKGAALGYDRASRDRLGRGMKARSAWILLLVAAGCSSAHPLAEDGGDTSGLGGPAVDAGGDLAAFVDGSSRNDSGSLGPADALSDANQGTDCGPPEPYTPCRTDADCGNPFLVCVPPDYTTVTVCRDPGQDAAINPACPSFAVWATAPLCPAEADVTSPVCEIRYQRVCSIDSDCGPAGFTCMGGRCQWTSTPCATVADCPTGWDCYVSCPCAGIRDTKTCMPPFAISYCGNCQSDGGVDDAGRRPATQ
jgi:hypothetical protein